MLEVIYHSQNPKYENLIVDESRNRMAMDGLSAKNAKSSRIYHLHFEHKFNGDITKDHIII